MNNSLDLLLIRF